MKKAKIVLLISLLIFIGLLLFFIFTASPAEEGPVKPVSKLEEYQKGLQENPTGTLGID